MRVAAAAPGKRNKGAGGGTRTVGQAAEHEVPVMSWFVEKVKQSKAGTGREAGPQGGRGSVGGRRAEMTLRVSP